MNTPGTAANSDARKRNAEREQSGSFSPTGPTSPTSTSTTTNADLPPLPAVGEAAAEAEVEAVARALARLEPGEDWPTNSALGGGLAGARDDEYRSAMRDQAREAIAALDAVRGTTQLAARVEALRQAAEVVVLDAGDEATGPEPDPNLAELAHCVAALAGVPSRSEAEIKAEALWEAGEAWPGGPTGFAPIPHEWLRDRAARLSKEADQ